MLEMLVELAGELLFEVAGDERTPVKWRVRLYYLLFGVVGLILTALGIFFASDDDMLLSAVFLLLAAGIAFLCFYIVRKVNKR